MKTLRPNALQTLGTAPDALLAVTLLTMLVSLTALLVAGLPRLARAEGPAACDAWDVDYLLSAKLKVTDTLMGMGNGTYVIGPGHARLRFVGRNGRPDGPVSLREYRTRDHLKVDASALVSSASVTTEAITQTTPDACGASAEGVLSGHTLLWVGPWRGMRSDGVLSCHGGLCGSFGAPPEGNSPVHLPPHPAPFKSFEFAEDGRTFSMDYSVVSSQPTPRQTSLVALAGREMSRACVAVVPCTGSGSKAPSPR